VCHSVPSVHAGTQEQSTVSTRSGAASIATCYEKLPLATARDLLPGGESLLAICNVSVTRLSSSSSLACAVTQRDEQVESSVDQAGLVFRVRLDAKLGWTWACGAATWIPLPAPPCACNFSLLPRVQRRRLARLATAPWGSLCSMFSRSPSGRSAKPGQMAMPWLSSGLLAQWVVATAFQAHLVFSYNRYAMLVSKVRERACLRCQWLAHRSSVIGAVLLACFISGQTASSLQRLSAKSGAYHLDAWRRGALFRRAVCSQSLEAISMCQSQRETKPSVALRRPVHWQHQATCMDFPPVVSRTAFLIAASSARAGVRLGLRSCVFSMPPLQHQGMFAVPSSKPFLANGGGFVLWASTVRGVV